MRGRRILLAVLLLLPAALPTASADAQAAAPPLWWGPTEAGDGYHFRIPVTVRNDFGTRLVEPVVLAQIDLAKELARAGWPARQSGGRPQPDAFELDLASVRVVSMSNFKPPSAGSLDGKAIVYDSTATGLNQNVAPSLVVPGLVDQAEDAPFNAQVNPAISVFWRVQGELEPTDPNDESKGVRHYYVYLDSAKNPGHDLAPPTGVETGSMRSLHWAGPSKVLYGFVPAPRENEDTPNVALLGLHAGTHVRVEVDRGGFKPSPNLAAVVLGAQQRRSVPLPAAEQGTAFRLISDDFPFMAYVKPQGFVPSLEGGFAGRRFLFEAADTAAYFVDAGDGAPTLINVQPLNDNGQNAGAPLQFNLNDATNPFPYTVGAWASGQSADGCVPRPRPGDAPALQRGTLYLASVVAGGPVMLQQGGEAPVAPVPALDGGPTGTSFMGVVSDTPYRQVGTQCVRVFRDQDWFMSGHQATAGRVTTEASGGEFPFQTVPATPGYAGPFVQGREFKNRPVAFGATQPVWLWSGFAGPTASPTMAGPFGGTDGRDFAGIGEAIVFGLYNETTLSVEEKFQAGSATRTEYLSPGGSFALRNRAGSDRLLSFHVASDRPVAVYPLSSAPGALAGRPFALPAAVAGELEYRGHMLAIQPAPGASLIKSTVPGEPVTYSLVIQNLGRTWTGAPLTDIADLSLRASEDGWTAAIDRPVVALGGTQSQEVRVTVTPPGDVQARSQGVVVVTATSRGNPAVVVAEKTTTYLKRSFDVGIWFDVVGGPKAQTRTMAVGQTAEYVLLVKNEGTVRDHVLLSMAPPERGWTTLLHQDGIETEALDLEPRESKALSLRVRPPSGATDEVLFTTVTATSAAQPAAFDRVTATSKVTAPSNLTARLTPPTALALPGREALFELSLQNAGQGSAELRLENRSDAPPTWPLPFTFLTGPAGSGRLGLDRVTIGPGETLRLGFSQTVPNAALEGESAAYRIAARAPDGSLAFEVFPTAVVAALHAVELGDAGTLALDPGGGTKNFTVRLANRGNLDERLDLQSGPLPQGWGVEVPDKMVLPRGEEASLEIQVKTAAASPAGLYALSLRLTSEDGAVQVLNLTLQLPLGANPLLDRVPVLEAQPGRPASTAVPVRNVANVPVRVRVVASPGEAWPLSQDATPLSLGPGANGSLLVSWQVPRSAPDGLSRHAARVLFDPERPDVALVERTLEVDVSIGRPRMRLSNESVVQTPGGRLVQFTLLNEGDRAAFDVVLELRAADEARDRLRIDVLPAGEQAELSLVDPVGEGVLLVVLDPDDAIVDVAGDAGGILELEQPGHPSPSVAAFGFVVALSIALWAGLRRRRG